MSSSPPTYTLYAPEASFRALAPLIAAEYTGVDITVCTDEAATAAILAQSPIGKLPLLQRNDDDSNTLLFSSHAIARYIAGLRRDVGLLGNNGDAAAAAAIDGWMEFCAAQIELPACVWFYPVAGYMPFVSSA